MMYDLVSQMEIDHIVLKYGCIYGGEKIVVIKAGLGGDYLGNENVYLKIAVMLHKKYGCSVISLSNPYLNNTHVDVDNDMNIIQSFIKKQKICNPELYFIGISNGCIKGLELAAKGLAFQRMVLINMPLMINFHKTKRYILTIPQTPVVAIYGQLDPSYSYVPFIEGIATNLETKIIFGADHNFSGKTDVLIHLADNLTILENEEIK